MNNRLFNHKNKNKMKKLIFTILAFAFIGLGFAQAEANSDPPNEEKFTISDVVQMNESIVVNGWNPISVDVFDHNEGNFVLIKYIQGTTSFVYASPIIDEIDAEHYKQIVADVFDCRYIQNSSYDKPKRKILNEFIGSAGGFPYSWNI